jgi:signal transduction histidine kinase
MLESLIVIARDVTKLRDVERLRDDFVATVSHELRTPLSPIKGWASTLLEFGDKLDDAERRDALQSILRQSQRLERLIVNLLEVSKIEHGAGDKETADVDVAAVAERVVSDFRAAWPERRFHVDGAAEPAWGHAKELWVEQILTNLVSNAVKYSPDNKPVEVTVEPAIDCVRVVVVDQGCGIPAHELERIFDRFHRGRETSTQTGTGLGLYIARHLANEIGGDVSVQSVPGRGSRFTLEVPAVARVIDVRSPGSTVRLEAS